MSSSRKIFNKVMISYFSVLLVPIIAGLFIYHSALTSVTRLFRDNMNSMLNQSITLMDVPLQELERIPYYLKNYSDMTAFLKMEEITEGSADNYQVYQAFHNMPKFSLVNSIIKDIQVVSLTNDFVIGQTNALRFTKQTYSSLFNYEGMDYTSFYSFLHENYFYNTFMLFHDQRGNAAPVLLFSFNYNNSATPLAVIMIHLNESYLQTILSELISEQESLVFILDQNNEMITSLSGKNCSLSLEEATAYVNQISSSDSDYKDYIVRILESNYNQWKYCIFSPYETVMQRMSATTKNLLFFTMISLLFSIAFTYYMVRRKATSLRQVICYLNGDPNSTPDEVKDEFSFITNSAVKLVSSNRQLQEIVHSQKPLLNAAALRNLLEGVAYSPQELRHLFQYLNIQPNNQLFAVMLTSAKPESPEKRAEYEKYPILSSALVQEHIEKNTLLPVYPLDMDSTHKALLFIGTDLVSSTFLEKIHIFTNRLVAETLKESGMHLTCYLSDPYEMIDHVPSAYRQAIVISKQATHKPDSFLYTAADIPPIQRFYYYPIQAERELIRLIKHGTRTELVTFMENLEKSNFIERNLSSSTLTQFIFPYPIQF